METENQDKKIGIMGNITVFTGGLLLFTIIYMISFKGEIDNFNIFTNANMAIMFSGVINATLLILVANNLVKIVKSRFFFLKKSEYYEQKNKNLVNTFEMTIFKIIYVLVALYGGLTLDHISFEEIIIVHTVSILTAAFFFLCFLALLNMIVDTKIIEKRKRNNVKLNDKHINELRQKSVFLYGHSVDNLMNNLRELNNKTSFITEKDKLNIEKEIYSLNQLLSLQLKIREKNRFSTDEKILYTMEMLYHYTEIILNKIDENYQKEINKILNLEDKKM